MLIKKSDGTRYLLSLEKTIIIIYERVYLQKQGKGGDINSDGVAFVSECAFERKTLID